MKYKENLLCDFIKIYYEDGRTGEKIGQKKSISLIEMDFHLLFSTIIRLLLQIQLQFRCRYQNRFLL